MNGYQRAIFVAKHMNVFLDTEKGRRILMLNIEHHFLNIYPFYTDIYDYGVKEFDAGIIYFFGPQPQFVVDFVVKTVIDNKMRTENSIIGNEVDKYYQTLVRQGRIEGQMALGRLPKLVIPKDIRKKIGEMTK